jgi:hypothetical protein
MENLQSNTVTMTVSKIAQNQLATRYGRAGQMRD